MSSTVLTDYTELRANGADHEATTADPRYAERLELQLAQADERAQTDGRRLQEALEKVERLQAQVADLKPLAEAAAEHRQKAGSEKRRADEAERALRSAQGGIAGLEGELAKAEGKIASLQEDLAAYEALDEKVKAAESLFSLLD